MKSTHSLSIAAVLAVALVSGCASPGQQGYTSSQPYPSQGSGQYATASYGSIDSIQVVSGGSGATGGGAVIGGLVGGLLGNQVGGGSGKAVATVAGVVGGAMVGNQVEKNRQGQRDMFQINVRLDNGSYQSVVQDSMNDLYVGNRVRIQGERVYRY